MAYTYREAIKTAYKYLQLDESKVQTIENTNGRGIIYEFEGLKTVIFIYPISCKQNNKQNFFDTRDSGAKDRMVTWDYAKDNELRYFCLGFNEEQERYKDYVLSLESDESVISSVSFRKSLISEATGTQVNIPNDFIPKEKFERIKTPKGFYISAIKREYIGEYIQLFDNRPYMSGDDSEIEIEDPEERNKRFFKEWMSSQRKPDGDSEAGALYSNASIEQYVLSVAQIPLAAMSDRSVFYTTNVEEVQTSIEILDSSENENIVQKSAVQKYMEFLQTLVSDGEVVEDMRLIFNTTLETKYERNRIVFGAPGTGKSYALKNDCNELLGNSNDSYERVTFHPDYTYSQFVGTYKPVMDEDGKSICYDFVPGPFMRVYVAALKSARTQNPQPYVLLIEEINRAKVAGVFGDVFQLLDRDDDGVSEYEIHASEDIRRYLARELGGVADNYKRIRIPNNMFIWATMNSADQGVFPMDTAFKRRWSFEYLGIDENEDEIKGKGRIALSGSAEAIEWNRLRKAINAKMSSSDFKINEDKLMGPFFLSKKVIASDENGMIMDTDKFINAFKSKVLMYLYEDAVKQSKHKFFDGCTVASKYSSICDAFDKIGIGIFGATFKEEFYDIQRDD